MGRTVCNTCTYLLSESKISLVKFPPAETLIYFINNHLYGTITAKNTLVRGPRAIQYINRGQKLSRVDHKIRLVIFFQAVALYYK